LQNMPRCAPRGPVPDGYVCKACDVKGHWIQACPFRVKKNIAATSEKRLAEEAPEEEFVIKKGNADGLTKPPKKLKIKESRFREPSAEDIAKAKAMMPIINPKDAPMCNCGAPAGCRKLRKKESPAYGKMFWWCAKRRDDATRCNFVKKADVI